MAEEYYVQIKNLADHTVVEEFGPHPEWKADSVDAGININLNHDEFYTLVGTAKQLKKGE